MTDSVHPADPTGPKDPDRPQSLDPERQRLAKEYEALKRRLFLVELGSGTIYVFVWVFSGIAPWLRDQIDQIVGLGHSPNLWLSVPLFALGMSVPYTILSAPLDYYGGFILSHRYGQSRQSLSAWLLDQAKSFAISHGLGLVILLIIYALLGAAPQTWWLWGGLVLLLFTVVLSNLAPILLFPLFFKYKPLEDEVLVQKLTQLAEQAGARVQGVYAFDMSRKTVTANAALMGLGNTRRIVLGDTLLENFTHAEIETVLAHEFGHHVHKDIPLGILVRSLITLVGLWLADAVMRWGVSAFGYQGLNDPATLPLLLLALSIFGLLTMPLGNLWSRWREVMADRYALETTGNPQAFIDAMTRLANQNLADVAPPVWVEFLLHGHPSIQRRVALARMFVLSLIFISVSLLLPLHLSSDHNLLGHHYLRVNKTVMRYNSLSDNIT